MKFFDEAGKMALGSRLRIFGEKFGEDAAAIYKSYGNELQPKWFPVFYVLAESDASTAGVIAEAIGHSHASVSKIVAEMVRAGLVLEKSDPADRRRTTLSLSKKGSALAVNLRTQYADVQAAIDALSREASQDLWPVLDEWERLLSQKSLYERVMAEKSRRESKRRKS